MCNIQNGSTCLFWTNLWGDQVQSQVYPELFSFARNKLLSFQKTKMMEPFHRLFYLPLSEEAFAQLGLLQNLLENQILSNDVDWWSYIWGSPFFSSRKAYKSLIGHAHIHQSFHWTCQNKHKVFSWLLLKDKLSTRNILRRKSMFLPSYNCVLCANNTEKTLEHLFLHCHFAEACWGLISLQVPNQADIFLAIESFKSQLHTPLFMNFIILLCWSIWISRNDLIFQGLHPSINSCRRIFETELVLLGHRVSSKHKALLEEWIACVG